MSTGDEKMNYHGDPAAESLYFEHSPFEAGGWEVRYAGVTYRPYAHDTVPNVMQRFLAKWLLGVTWIKLE
jgi:hypothetical protein